MLTDWGQQTRRRLVWPPEADPQAPGCGGCVEQRLLSLFLKKITEQMTSFTVNVNVTCPVLGVGVAG